MRLVLFLQFFWLVLPSRERKNFILMVVKKHKSLMYLRIFNTKLCSFQNLILGFYFYNILSIFCKFQPRYSSKLNSYKKRKVVNLPCLSVKFAHKQSGEVETILKHQFSSLNPYISLSVTLENF